MVASNDYRQYGCSFLARIVSIHLDHKIGWPLKHKHKLRAHLLIEPTKGFILMRYCHTLQVSKISDCLKIATNEQQIDFVLVLGFESSNMVINGVKLAMTAPFNSNFHSWRTRASVSWMIRGMFKAQDAGCTRQWSSDAFWKESDHRWWTDLCSIYIESAIKNLYSAIGLCTKLCITFTEHVFWNLPSLYRQSFSVWISFTRTAFFILAMMWFYRLTWPIPDK